MSPILFLQRAAAGRDDGAAWLRGCAGRVRGGVSVHRVKMLVADGRLASVARSAPLQAQVRRDAEEEKFSKGEEHFWAPCKSGPLVPAVSGAFLGQARR